MKRFDGRESVPSLYGGDTRVADYSSTGAEQAASGSSIH